MQSPFQCETSFNIFKSKETDWAGENATERFEYSGGRITAVQVHITLHYITLHRWGVNYWNIFSLVSAFKRVGVF